jgi:surface antigen
MGRVKLEHSRTVGRQVLSFVLLAAAMFIALSATWAEPPPWAPAHGWRKKYDPHYVGYEGRRWPSDYGVLRGSCNREAIGAVLGAAVGGAIGSRVGQGDERAVATVVGVVLGAVVGAQIGRSMDEEDRACMGHALELSEAGRPVYWQNERSGAQYVLTPLGETAGQGSRPCRDFQLEVRLGSKRDLSRQRACRNGDGSWSLGRR